MQNENSLRWEYVLKREPKLDFFFNITIPAAKKRKSPCPHLIIICEYSRIRKLILENFSAIFGLEQSFILEAIGIKPGDVAAVLSGMHENGVLLLKNGASINKMQPAAQKVLTQAISQGCLEVEIGKGASAQKYCLDIPAFSFITFFERANQIEKGFKQAFEEIIEINSFSADELCALEVQITAVENGINFDGDAIAEIVRASNGSYRTAGRYVRWVRDYMLVKNDVFEYVPKEYVVNVISQRQ